MFWFFFPLVSAHPVRKRISGWGCGAVTLGVWLLSLALAAPPSLYTRYLDLRPTGIDLVICEEFWPDGSNLRLLYSCFILTTSYMIPLLSVSVSYCAITISLKQHSVPGEQSSRQQGWNQKRRKTFLLLVASVLAFALCWLPLQVSPLETIGLMSGWAFLFDPFDDPILENNSRDALDHMKPDNCKMAWRSNVEPQFRKKDTRLTHSSSSRIHRKHGQKKIMAANGILYNFITIIRMSLFRCWTFCWTWTQTSTSSGNVT